MSLVSIQMSIINLCIITCLVILTQFLKKRREREREKIILDECFCSQESYGDS